MSLLSSEGNYAQSYQRLTSWPNIRQLNKTQAEECLVADVSL